jgi:hypothetical protein
VIGRGGVLDGLFFAGFLPVWQVVGFEIAKIKPCMIRLNRVG